MNGDHRRRCCSASFWCSSSSSSPSSFCCSLSSSSLVVVWCSLALALVVAVIFVVVVVVVVGSWSSSSSSLSSLLLYSSSLVLVLDVTHLNACAVAFFLLSQKRRAWFCLCPLFVRAATSKTVRVLGPRSFVLPFVARLSDESCLLCFATACVWRSA